MVSHSFIGTALWVLFGISLAAALVCFALAAIYDAVKDDQ